MDHLVGHYGRVKSDATLKQTSQNLREKMAGVNEPINIVLNLEKLPAEDELRSEYNTIDCNPQILNQLLETMKEKIIGPFNEVREAISKYHDSLYRQQHAFYFRRVLEWKESYEVRRYRICKNRMLIL